MGNRTEIAWMKIVDGEKHDVRARRRGDVWEFTSRLGRGNPYQPVEHPDLDDWLRLLDGVRRRIGRNRKQPAEERDVLRLIRMQFPDAEIE